MRGYLCDGCGAFDSGESDQRDGNTPPKGWSILTLPGVKSATRHLCADCARSALKNDIKYQEMRA